MQTFMAFLAAVAVCVVGAALNIAIVPWPKSPRPPGVYSFVTGLPKADRLDAPKLAGKVPVKVILFQRPKSEMSK